MPDETDTRRILPLNGWRSVEDAREAPARDDPRDFINREDGFLSEKMGNRLSLESKIVLGEGGLLYRYENGVFRSHGVDWIKSRVRDVMGPKFKGRHIDETLKWFRAQMPIVMSDPPIDRLNFRNGLFRLDSANLGEHTDTFHTTVQVPVNWNPSASCPRILKFLREVLPDEETVSFFIEIIGYALYPRNSFHVAVLLLGPGRNGKSVLLQIIRSLLGEPNVSAVPLQAFSEDRFATASLLGRLANICGDLDARSIKRTDRFKMLTGGDPLHAERKYGQPFTFTSFALPIFSANETPLSVDQSAAWFERWLVVPMERVIPTDQRDPNLIINLTTKSELEGLLVLAVEGLKRLLQRGRFEIPAHVKKAGGDYRERLDSVGSFLEDRCRFGPDETVLRHELMRMYNQYCEDLKFPPVRQGAVYSRLANDSRVKPTKSSGSRGFRGVGVSS